MLGKIHINLKGDTARVVIGWNRPNLGTISFLIGIFENYQKFSKFSFDLSILRIEISWHSHSWVIEGARV